MITRKISSRHSQPLILILYIVFSYSSCFASSQGLDAVSNAVQSAVFLSPPIHLRPGYVQNKYCFNIPFPKGHIGLKSFNGEVVDENGNSTPLHETYLHHWVVLSYHIRKGAVEGTDKIIYIKNSGPCKNVGQYYGLGSEARKTNTWVPDPYGIQVGNPAEIPEGYEEKWLLNVHAIDTRGVEDRLGCTECNCSLYNVTLNESGMPLVEGYVGGRHCCYDETQCRLKIGFNGSSRNVYLRYTVKWVEWSPSIIPVKIYILDVADTVDHLSGLSAGKSKFNCKVEYDVPSCGSMGEKNGGCVDVKKAKVFLSHGGDIIYGVAHQHSGGIGTALYGEDGQLLCSSNPFYGKGEEPGNEAGYIVGMSTCYPKPGSLNIKNGELVTLISNYSSTQMHTGVMGLFYLLLAEPRVKPTDMPSSQGRPSSNYWWMLLLGGIIAAFIFVAIHSWRHDEKGYQRADK